MKLRLSILSLVCVCLMAIAAAPSVAATVAVGTCLPGKVSFDSLTDAVQGAPSGSTILVCPGIYAEQVVINKSLTLKGQGTATTAYPVITPPAGGLLANATGLFINGSFYGGGTPMAAQVLITGGVQVTITDMALDATGYNLPTCAAVVVGVLAQDASVELDRVAVKNQMETGPAPCSSFGSGAGVLAQNDSSNPTTAKVTGSTFLNASQAFEGDGSSLTSTLTNNAFTGNPASNANAISIINGNSTVKGNSIANYSFPATGGNINIAAYGVYLSCVSNGTVQNNTISSTQVGVILANPTCPTSGVSVLGNDVTNATYVGIDMGELDGLAQGNSVYSSLTAFRLPGSAATNTISGNTVNDVCAVVGLNPLAGANTVVNNIISNALNITITNTTALCP